MGKPCPTVRGRWLLGSLLELQRDPLTLFERATAEQGDVVRIRFGHTSAVLVNHPDHLERVLVTNGSNYARDRAFQKAGRLILGEAMGVSDGEAWKRRRRLINPMFHRQKLNQFAHTMVAAVRRLQKRWSEIVRPGEPLDISAELSRLTIDVIGHTLFGAEIEEHTRAIMAAEDSAARDVFSKLRSPFQAASFLPTPANLRLRSARRTFEALFRSVVENARRDPSVPTVTAMLVQARDEETGAALADDQVFDQLTGLFLAGHETSANALSWTLFFLAQHPAVVEKLLAEYDAVLGDRDPDVDDLPRLELNRNVLNESMRLRPPVWLFPRTAVAQDEIAGYRIPPGQMVWISPWVLHRHPAFWQDPEGFDPDRFSEERTRGRPKLAYLPFGAGQKMCIGTAFAMMEIQLALPFLVRGWAFRLANVAPVIPDPYVTLRPRGGLPMYLAPRAGRNRDDRGRNNDQQSIEGDSHVVRV
jgi:cytochrome P450